jgi:uncharacterized protein (UPF0332 family)
MDAHTYLAVAESLASNAQNDPTLPHFDGVCRSAISRAYYAVFLLARELIEELGIDARRIPNPHATLEQAFRNSGVLSLVRLANTLDSLASLRATADYDLRNTDVESLGRVQDVIGSAQAAILQLDIIRAGRLSPPLDRSATADAILKWARDNGKPLWKKASS